ncbi:hypothetical protein PAEAM_56680 [Paenibacillus sp. GM1FR]|uniref:hypothetical protein n=1 Tax=Paenibacillus sp. GM1FR TaxID=2059267 RepID=UPI000C26E254|nr:hypothetical protein [Paenibacillus sp. GM1FR]PJN48806.1 hypothetical protein PAEAM_56680 [Paenibacillus sp. GM1FR]
MPTQINKTSDPFSITENEVNLAVAEFLRGKGANILRVAIDREQGYDVHAEMKGYSFIIESKGSRKNNQTENVFDSGQLKVHASAQIFYLMKKLEIKSETTFLVLANPDIPRIRKLISDVSTSLDQLGLIQFWVGYERGVRIECPKELREVLSGLGLE